MTDEKKEAPRIYSIEEAHAITLMNHAAEQLEIVADLLSEKGQEDPLDLRVLTLLSDSFSSNYHIWRILKTNLQDNITTDKEKEVNVVAMSEQDLFLTENAILAKSFSSVELLKLNYSLSLH